MEAIKYPLVSALSQEMIHCHTCDEATKVVLEKTDIHVNDGYRCPRCYSSIHLRKVNSINRTWGFVLLGFMMFIPSHVFPIMVITELGEGTYEKTIIGGVIGMFDNGLWHLGLIIFFASVMIPLFKLLGLAGLLLAVRYKWLKHRLRLTQLYRIIVFVGRWAMIDIFFAAILISLVQFGGVANILAGYAATFFASMCIITMIAAEAFDPRFLWDHFEEEK
ncbi:MAG: paraquat-inducible membrane protein A [Moraxellaceae bacterium]|nr:MAG: paraquat-inducible membrane protein A [Moraxellaceae bacterium]